MIGPLNDCRRTSGFEQDARGKVRPEAAIAGLLLGVGAPAYLSLNLNYGGLVASKKATMTLASGGCA
jgi:hypothetical protein